MKKNLKLKFRSIVEMKAIKGKSLHCSFVDRVLVSTENVEGIDPLGNRKCYGTLIFIPQHLPKTILDKTEEWIHE